MKTPLDPTKLAWLAIGAVALGACVIPPQPTAKDALKLAHAVTDIFGGADESSSPSGAGSEPLPPAGTPPKVALPESLPPGTSGTPGITPSCTEHPKISEAEPKVASTTPAHGGSSHMAQEAKVTVEGSCAVSVHLVGGTRWEGQVPGSAVGSLRIDYHKGGSPVLVANDGSVMLSGRLAATGRPAMQKDDSWIQWTEQGVRAEPRFAEEGAQMGGDVCPSGLRVRSSTKGQELVVGGFGQPERVLLRTGDRLPRSQGKWVQYVYRVVEYTQSGMATVMIGVTAPGRTRVDEGLVVLPSGELLTEDELRVGIGLPAVALGANKLDLPPAVLLEDGLLFFRSGYAPRVQAKGYLSEEALRDPDTIPDPVRVGPDGTFHRLRWTGSGMPVVLPWIRGLSRQGPEVFESRSGSWYAAFDPEKKTSSKWSRIVMVGSNAVVNGLLTWEEIGTEEVTDPLSGQPHQATNGREFAGPLTGLSDGSLLCVCRDWLSYRHRSSLKETQLVRRSWDGTLDTVASLSLVPGSSVAGFGELVFYGEDLSFRVGALAPRGVVLHAPVAPNAIGSKPIGDAYFGVERRQVRPLLVPGAKVRIAGGEEWTIGKSNFLLHSPDGRFALFAVTPVERRPDGAHFTKLLRVELPPPM